MGLAITFIARTINLARSKEIRAQSRHTSNWGMIRLFCSPTQSVQREALRNISHRLLSGEVKLENAEKIFPKDVLIKVSEYWGINGRPHSENPGSGNTREFTLTDIAEKSTNKRILASLAENPEVAAIAATNPHCPPKAVAVALCRMPKEDSYNPEEGDVGFALIGNNGDVEYPGDPRESLSPRPEYPERTLQAIRQILAVHKNNRTDIELEVRELDAGVSCNLAAIRIWGERFIV
jgi:hypothetical protein